MSDFGSNPVPNVPDWEPITTVDHSGSASVSVTLNDTFRSVAWAITDVDFPAATDEDLTMICNGDTGANYTGYSVDGSLFTTSPSIPVAQLGDGTNNIADSSAGTVTGVWNNKMNAHIRNRSRLGSIATTAVNGSLTSPLTELSWQSAGGSAWSGFVEVWGRPL